jgi:hypothetical protein
LWWFRKFFDSPITGTDTPPGTRSKSDAFTITNSFTVPDANSVADAYSNSYTHSDS